MLLGAHQPWLLVYMLLGSSGTYVTADEFASTSTQVWRLLLGSSSVATHAGAVGRIPIVCGIGVPAAAVLPALIPVRYHTFSA
jgi:hypothetical protein